MKEVVLDLSFPIPFIRSGDPEDRDLYPPHGETIPLSAISRATSWIKAAI
jgi:hypothetical protein